MMMMVRRPAASRPARAMSRPAKQASKPALALALAQQSPPAIQPHSLPASLAKPRSQPASQPASRCPHAAPRRPLGYNRLMSSNQHSPAPALAPKNPSPTKSAREAACTPSEKCPSPHIPKSQQMPYSPKMSALEASHKPTPAPKPPKRPKRRRGGHRPRAEINAALDIQIAAALAATPAPIHISPADMIAACDLIEAAIPALPPLPRQEAQSGLAGLAQISAGSPADNPQADAIAPPATSAAPPHNAGDMRSVDDFRAWVAAGDGSRARIAKYLAEVARTGKLSASLDVAGLTLGAIAGIQQRHPLIRYALDIMRATSANRLVGRAREAVEDVIQAPDDQAILLKAAGIAMQYGPKASPAEQQGEQQGGRNVQIVINLGSGQAAQAPRAIPPEDVLQADRESAIFIRGNASR